MTLVWPWSYYNNLRNNYYNYYLRRRYRYKRGKHVAQEAWRCSVCSMLPALLHFSSLTGCHYFACVYTYILETNRSFFCILFGSLQPLHGFHHFHCVLLHMRHRRLSLHQCSVAFCLNKLKLFIWCILTLVIINHCHSSITMVTCQWDFSVHKLSSTCSNWMSSHGKSIGDLFLNILHVNKCCS